MAPKNPKKKFRLMDSFIKTRGLTFPRVVMAIAFGVGSSVYIYRPSMVERRKLNEQLKKEDTERYVI